MERAPGRLGQVVGAEGLVAREVGVEEAGAVESPTLLRDEGR